MFFKIFRANNFATKGLISINFPPFLFNRCLVIVTFAACILSSPLAASVARMVSPIDLMVSPKGLEFQILKINLNLCFLKLFRKKMKKRHISKTKLKKTKFETKPHFRDENF